MKMVVAQIEEGGKENIEVVRDASSKNNQNTGW